MIDEPTRTDWQLAEVFVEPQSMFVLWAISVYFCTREEDFHHHFGPDFPVNALIEKLELQGFIQRDDTNLVLTATGLEAVAQLGRSELSEFADLIRPSEMVQVRFGENNGAVTDEAEVERRSIAQLIGLGWEYIPGHTGVPYLTERDSFREVLLTKRLRRAISAINLNSEGNPWLDEQRITNAIGDLQRLASHSLMEANQAATELLLKGTFVEGDPTIHRGRNQSVKYIDFENPDRNDFLIINQFRVDVPGRDTFIVPDIVLFVNGIPLVVIECKSPRLTDPMEAGIKQLLRYSNRREWVEVDEGVEKLFHYVQAMISTYWYEARLGTVGHSFEHYQEWKDTSPVPLVEVADKLGVQTLSSQQTLIAGMLRREHLLDIVRHFILFDQSGSSTIKIITRYQQFRAVQAAIKRLLTGQQRHNGEPDKRGGIIWHTQGSGKSLSMVFLIRKMRSLPELRRFKIVAVTDRTDLEQQLSTTASLTGETPRRITDSRELLSVLREPGPGLIFAMLQKYQAQDNDAEASQETEDYPELNPSPDILVLVDEAHRSHTQQLHANLTWALPNAVRIAFTGTPILLGEQKKTHEIFGGFIDRYTIQQAEEDGATVPIRYEGRTSRAVVADGRTLDQIFEQFFADRTPAEVEAIKRKYATQEAVLEATELIATKAENILRHYVDNILPNGFKAQLVATTRLAAVRYQQALVEAHRRLVVELEAYDERTADDVSVDRLPSESEFLGRAREHLHTIRRLEFAAVISSEHNDDPTWKKWSDRAQQNIFIQRFKKPLVHETPTRQDGLAFLIVKSMLLTGFDAPIEQVLYLDRSMRGHELLQAIARVNRTYPNKTFGLVVDYYGIARNLKEALAVYRVEDIHGALLDLKDELPKLTDRHRRVMAVFHERGIQDISNVQVCVDLLRDLKVRADFDIKLKKFLESIDIIMPRPEALPYMRDASTLGLINKLAANLYRDSQMDLMGAGLKVRQLIDQHIRASGIDPQSSPVSIADKEFERTVDTHSSDQAKASEMEHALRYHINQHLQEDPVYYRRLSERLEEILQSFQNNWHDLYVALRPMAEEVRRGPSTEEAQLVSRTEAPFLRILLSETAGLLPAERLEKLPHLAVDMVNHIRQQIQLVDFWRRPHAQDVLRGWIIEFLDDYDIVPLDRQQAVADQIVALAKALHTRLIHDECSDN